MNEEEIIGFDALYAKMWKCKQGTMWKNPVGYYVLHGIEETLKLEGSLKDGTFKHGKTNCFILTYPKERECISITFRDRVYQRSLNDNAIYPAMVKHFIYDNHACQKGKGTDSAMDRLEQFLHRYYINHGTNKGVVLQADIEGYYRNLLHDVGNDTLRRYVPSEAYKRAADVLSHQYAGDKGYNPGSQMVQIVGISALNPLDHFIKERLGAKLYLRYMDDFLIIHESKEFLEDALIKITEKLSEISLNPHPKKTRIYDLKEGIHFLGFRYYLTDTGKVVRLINPQNVKHERRKLKRMVEKARRGELTKAKVDECYQCWKAHAKRGNTYKLLQRMDKYYKDLWRAKNENGIADKTRR